MQVRNLGAVEKSDIGMAITYHEKRLMKKVFNAWYFTRVSKHAEMLRYQGDIDSLLFASLERRCLLPDPHHCNLLQQRRYVCMYIGEVHMTSSACTYLFRHTLSG